MGVGAGAVYEGNDFRRLARDYKRRVNRNNIRDAVEANRNRSRQDQVRANRRDFNAADDAAMIALLQDPPPYDPYAEFDFDEDAWIAAGEVEREFFRKRTRETWARDESQWLVDNDLFPETKRRALPSGVTAVTPMPAQPAIPPPPTGEQEVILDSTGNVEGAVAPGYNIPGLQDVPMEGIPIDEAQVFNENDYYRPVQTQAKQKFVPKLLGTEFATQWKPSTKWRPFTSFM